MQIFSFRKYFADFQANFDFFCWRSSPSGTQRPSRSQGTNLRGPSNFLSSVYILVQKLILLISAILKCYVSLPGNQQILQKHFLPNLTFCQAIFDFFYDYCPQTRSGPSRSIRHKKSIVLEQNIHWNSSMIFCQLLGNFQT